MRISDWSSDVCSSDLVAVRKVDRTITEVAAAHGGRYSIDNHLSHDPTATERFAEAHVRRLEAIRRKTGAVEREPDGSWVIALDRSEERRVGKECVSTCRSRWSPDL